MYPKAMIFIAIVGVSLSLLLGFFSVISWEGVGVLIAVFIGIPTLITQVNVKPKEDKREPKQVVETEEKEVFKDETIRVSPDHAYHYEFELERDDILKGEISSNTHFCCLCEDKYFRSIDR